MLVNKVYKFRIYPNKPVGPKLSDFLNEKTRIFSVFMNFYPYY